MKYINLTEAVERFLTRRMAGPEVFRSLIENRRDEIDLPDQRNLTPLKAAILCGMPSDVVILLDVGAAVTPEVLNFARRHQLPQIEIILQAAMTKNAALAALSDIPHL